MNRFQKYMKALLGCAVLAGMASLYSCGGDDVLPPVTVAFSPATSAVAENSNEGATVTISFEKPAPDAGTLVLTVTNGSDTEDADYTLTPAAASGEIEIAVAAGATSATFNVKPTDNAVIDGDKSVVFTITEAEGGLKLGAANLTHTLTITDDEVPTSIANIRAMFTGEAVDITSSMFVKGTVTSTNGNLTARNAFIQDETGGIVVRFVSNNADAITRGDIVEIQLNGSQISEFRGLLQLNNVPNENAKKVGTGPLPAYKTITLSQLADNEGMLVKIVDATFPDADGTATLSGSRKIKDASGEAVLRTESYAPFKDNVMPLGKGELKGIASDFDGAQLIPFEATDIFANNPTAVITASTESLTFGETSTNETSAEQTYTVSATGLTGDLTINATGPFMIASTGDFGTSLTLSPSGGNVAETTIKVKFAPTANSTGTKTGEIKHSATGAVSKNISLSGEEKAIVVVEPTSIASVRAMFDGTTSVTVTEPLLIKGVVTSSNSNLTSRNLFIQDATGGIVVRFNANNTFVRGDEIEVRLDGGSIGAFNGLVQVSNIANSEGKKLGTAALPAYKTITIGQLAENQGLLVQIVDVSFPDADGVKTVSGNANISDASGTAVMRTENYAPFKDKIQPNGTGTIKGIAGIYQTATSGGPQIIPFEESDIFGN